jgi:Flp pilus assembly pilin Flp
MITKIFGAVSRFSKEESGAAMVEYAVALLVVTAIGIGVMSAIGGNAGALTLNTCNELNAGVSAADGVVAVECQPAAN